LDIAFNAASAMPVNPHIKNRSRAQEAVVTACFELEQPQLALRYIEKIGNWRRGAGYADLAFYCAKRGFTNEAESYLNLALRDSETTEEFRKDRIKGKIAKTHAYMGQIETAAKFERGIEASESGKAAQAEAMICPTDSFDDKIKILGKLALSENFDVVRNALGAYTELYNRFYTNIERRKLIEKNMKTSWIRMPVFIRIDLLTKMADFSLAHSDQVKALELVNETKTIMDSAKWKPRFRIPLMARLAELRFRAGAKEQAQKEIKNALKLFEAKRSLIVNIYRAQMLRSIAKAYHTMGDIAVALDIYKRAVEAGVENPNSRPRAEDLTATCCSMALHEVKPDPELLKRIQEIRDGLGDPW
jgi:hypothetical protein